MEELKRLSDDIPLFPSCRTWQEAGWFLMRRYCVNSRMWSDEFYGLLQSLLPASVRISHARIPDSPSFPTLPGKSSCRNA